MKTRSRKSFYEPWLRGTKQVPGQVVPRVFRIVSRIGIGILRRRVADVHPETRFAGHLLNNEKPAALVVGEIVAVDDSFRFFGRQIKAEKPQIRLNFSSEEREFEFDIELRRGKVHANDIVPVAVVDGLLGVYDRIWIAFQQFTSNYQHYVFLTGLHVGFRTGRRLVGSQRARRLPGVNFRDVFQLLCIGWCVRVADTFYFPELPEVTTPEIRWIFAPQKFAAHFMIEADHVRLNEFRVCLQERNRIWRNQLQIWNQQLLVNVAKIPIHRIFKIGMSHGIHDLFGLEKITTGNFDECGQPQWKGNSRIDRARDLHMSARDVEFQQGRFLGHAYHEALLQRHCRAPEVTSLNAVGGRRGAGRWRARSGVTLQHHSKVGARRDTLDCGLFFDRIDKSFGGISPVTLLLQPVKAGNRTESQNTA